MKIAIVSACSTGVASTYMAAEALELAARAQGHEVKVETQGTIGIENKISREEAQAVDAVIFATDINIREKERFAGKPIFEVKVTDAIHRAEAVVKRVAEIVAQKG
jgi:fructose-specific PTS system IIB-like component